MWPLLVLSTRIDNVYSLTAFLVLVAIFLVLTRPSA